MKNLILVASSVLLLASGLVACAGNDNDSDTLSEVYSCDYNVNGKSFKGNTRAECEAGAGGIGQESGSNNSNTSSKVSSKVGSNAGSSAGSRAGSSAGSSVSGNAICSFDISGTIINGYSQDECNALASSLSSSGGGAQAGASTGPINFPSTPMGGNSSAGGVYDCSYNVNGVEERGSTKAECDALAKKYGNPFGGF